MKLLEMKHILDRWAPEILDELAGMAEGAQVDLYALLAMNCWELNGEDADRCTVVVVHSPREGILIAKNNDSPPTEDGRFLIRRGKADGGLPFFQVGYAGSLSGLDMMNAEGLCNTHGSVGSCFARTGMRLDIRLQLYRLMQRCRNTDELVAGLNEIPLTGKGFSIAVADKRGSSVILDAAVPFLAVRARDRAFAYSTNLYEYPGMENSDMRLPEKRSVRPGTVKSENEGHSIRAAQWKSAGEETLKKARKLTKSAGKAFRRFGNTLEKRVHGGDARLSDRVKPSGQSSKPVRTAAARRGNGMRGSNASMRISGASSRRQPQRRVPPHGTRNACANVRSRQGRETFLERHLRSLIAMALLAVTVIVFCVWSTSTTSGKRTFAQLGIGSASGYILLGDDCMESGNYARAVEHYYRALSRHTTYESAIKLARAYQMTGDTDREASVLLLCADRFETEREPYERLKALYPTLTRRPETVQNALNRGAHVLGDASIAQ